MTFDLVAVGDISLGDSPPAVGDGVHDTFERLHKVNAAYPFQYTAPLFEGAAAVFGNLETVLSHKDLSRWRGSSVEMRGHPAAAQRLARAGFTLLNVANNHTMQHGKAAFAETVDLLRQQEIGVVGLASHTRRECVPARLNVNGLNVTILGFAFERDKYWRGPVEYAFGPDCDMVKQVRAARESSDIVICSVHWGVEFVRHPSGEEERLGHQLVEAGADLVLGHHPHVARRVERCGRGLIAYSLGNFVFDMLWNKWLRVGLVLRVRVSKRGIEDYKTDLVWIGDDYQPRPLVHDQRLVFTDEFEALAARPDWISSEVEYTREYERHVSRNRYQSYRHFLRHVNDRPFIYTLQTLLRTARRKAVGALHSPNTFASIVGP